MISTITPIQSHKLSSLHDGEIHVWIAPLHHPEKTNQRLFVWLSDDERVRADRFRFEKDRSRFIVGRGILRQLLASYLDEEPQTIQFDYGEFGKPALLSDASDLCFNLSHANEMAVYVISRGRKVGIDIEYIQPVPEMEQIARQFFSAKESDLLGNLRATQKLEAFFNCWTRKEAYIKAKGEGLSMPLHQFDVAFLPDEPARLLATRCDPLEASRWEMISFCPASNYIAALAAEKPIVNITLGQWVLPSHTL
jgi:4'-phosphopantetheinyl transferase